MDYLHNCIKIILLICSFELLVDSTVISYQGDKTQMSVYSSNNKEWIIISNVKHQFFCKSNVLVRWRSTGQLGSSWIEASQEWNPSKNSYLANLHVRASVSTAGFLICEPVDQKYQHLNLTDRVYLFVKDENLFRENTGILQIPSNVIGDDNSCQTIIVPCALSHPLDKEPKLLGVMNNGTSSLIDASEYDITVGFRADLCVVAKYYQVYCTIYDQIATYNVTVKMPFEFNPEENVVYPLKNVPFEISCSGDLNLSLSAARNTTFSEIYNIVENQTVTIQTQLKTIETDETIECADSNFTHIWTIKAPNISQSVQKRVGNGFRRYDQIRDVYECHNANPKLSVRNLFCENQNDCDLKQDCFETGVCSNYIKEGVSCLDPNCLKIDYPFRHGIFECKSSTTKVTDMYFTGLNRILYFTNAEIPSAAIVNILEFSSPFYVGLDDSITVVCEYSLFLLVKGVTLSVIYENGEKITIETRISKEERDKLKPRVTRNVELHGRKLIPTLNMTDVVCEAKLQNGSGWIQSTKRLEIIEAKKPKILNKNLKITFSVGDPEPVFINCEAEGVPRPTVFWRKLNDNDSNTTESMSKVLGSTLKFDSVEPSITGEYECTVRNERYNLSTSKVFRVDLVENGNSYLIYTIIGVIIVLLVGSLVLLMQYKKRVKDLNKYIKELTHQEITEFFDGLQNTFRNRSETIDAVANALKMPYNDVYEVDSTSVVYDSCDLIGKGSFGIVFKAIKNPGNKIIAVKTVQDDVDISTFKTILSEIKILIYLGFHPNIVEFVGAVTKDIQQLQVKVLLEYCPNGDLHGYLRQMERSSEDYMNHSNMKQCQLFKWCIQIAHGLEHLVKRRIIHGDLATRNILLDGELTAKITDFGLSTKSVDYSVYVKKGKQAPLPWRWMALESLTMFAFSSASDVWSFGVTIWEIFTFGEVPYPGQTWNDMFVQSLRDGYRLTKPQKCSDEIYNLMLACWTDDYVKRPSVQVIKESLEKSLNVCYKITESSG